jgi:hypothetical protein
MLKSTIPVIIVLTLTFIISCSSGDRPVTPSDSSGLSNIPTNGTLSDSDSSSLYKNVMGAWKVIIDSKSLTAELVPARNAHAIGDIFDADLSQFLTKSPCSNCMRITNVGLDYWQNLRLTLAMKHPFLNATTRPDLHGFDVRAIFIMPSDTEYPAISVTLPDTSQVTASYSSALLNADGLTSHYDSLVTDPRYFIGGADVGGSLNPYLRFFDDFTEGEFDPHAPAGHNVMPAGSSEYSRTAVIDKTFLSGNVEIYIVADVAYGHSAVLANRQNPQYYLPWFNRTEPWRVEYWLENNDLNVWSATSTADLVIQVFDWQQNATVDPAYPDPANLDGIPQSSQIDQVIFSIPGCMDNPITESDPVSGTGTPSDPLEFRLEITNTNQADKAVHGLLAVRDELHGQASPNARMPIPVTPSGFPYDTEDILDYTMYFDVIVPVYGYAAFPFGYYFPDFTMSALYSDLYVSTDSTTHATNIHAEYTNDPSHVKYRYQWDYDYDGVTFTMDGEGNPSPDIVLPDPGITNVGLRIRTTSEPPQEYIGTFPVFTEGEVFNRTHNSSDAAQYTTGYSGGKPFISTIDNYYFAYSREVSGQRDIYLMIGDWYGNAETFRVTDTPAPCNDPSVYAGSSSPMDEVYIVFSQIDAGTSHVYSTYGNLDGTGFSPSNIKRITASAGVGEYIPCLTRDGNDLHVYYAVISAGTSKIYHSMSSNQARTWSGNNWIANNGSEWQTGVTVDSGLSYVYVFWEDWTSSSGDDSDIWMVRSTTGSSANTIMDISIFGDSMIETLPCVDAGYSYLCLAYVAESPTTSETSLHLKFVDDGTLSFMDCPIKDPDPNLTYKSPAVSVMASTLPIVAWSVYNPTTDEIFLNASTFELKGAFGWIEEEPLIEMQLDGSTSNSNYASLNPAITSRSISGMNAAALIGWKDYTHGTYESPVIPQTLLGHINTAMYLRHFE